MVKRLKEAKINTKIFMYLLGFSTLLIIILWILQIILLDDFYKVVRTREIEKVTNVIVNNLTRENITAIVDEYGEKYNLNIEVKRINHTIPYFDTFIEPVYQYPNRSIMNMVSKSIYYYLYQEAYKNNSTYMEIIDIQPVGDRIFMTKIIDFIDFEVILYISSSIIPIDAMVNTLRFQLMVITAFMILLSVFLAIIISKSISRPIVSINNSAKQFANGDYNTNFETTGYKEIIELSNTLNYASSELSKVENLRRELIANISHDLRTPLTLISGYAEAMRDLPGENNPENAQVIIDESNRLSSLVKDVLDLSKLQSGNDGLNKTEYNLTEKIASDIARLQELTKAEGYNIEFVFETEINVIADENKISQALYNLLINALNYTGDDKFIQVSQVTSENCVKISVKDTGVGIKEQDIDYIWDRYYKINEHHKRGVTGSGIGLSIVKEIISLHDGSYGINSEYNIGSTFWFCLPINNNKPITLM